MGGSKRSGATALCGAAAAPGPVPTAAAAKTVLDIRYAPIKLTFTRARAHAHMQTCTHARTQARMYWYARTPRRQTRVHTRAHTRIHAHTHTHTHTHTHGRTHTVGGTHTSDSAFTCKRAKSDPATERKTGVNRVVVVVGGEHLGRKRETEAQVGGMTPWSPRRLRWAE